MVLLIGVGKGMIHLSLRMLTVSELTTRIKGCIEVPELMELAVVGEISNFKHHSSGHMYFTLKDDKSRVKAVMFRGRNRYLRFRPENGQTAAALGSIGLYEPNGEYQLYVNELLPQGLGDLHLAYEQLKEKLAAEGLFAPEAKRLLPALPRRVAVITSPTSAALRDVLSVTQRRFPGMPVVVVPAIVQGDEGPASVVRAFSLAEASGADVVLLVRGGGSIEELWTFNDEQVARAIRQCSIPVVSGVGHETDFTIADLVADQRAPTPSAAAELAVPDCMQLRDSIRQSYDRLTHAVRQIARSYRRRLEYVSESVVLKHPERPLARHRQRVDELLSRAGLNMHHRRRSHKQMLALLTGKLDSLSPLATLERGYAVCQKQDGQVIKESTQTAVGESIDIKLHRGRLQCVVEKGVLPDGQGDHDI